MVLPVLEAVYALELFAGKAVVREWFILVMRFLAFRGTVVR